ncbi:hypothetical protein DPMN_178291 [Dreissena polymorpha]|uniref:Uncharacterized protein n=1 Tax=Dreissena polymorpha TaxID=45954 RepID=A0A9D4ILA4_DREPO|nr:hypothetical protein DPMN_178291 [Dreissena polymorpha]
MTYQAAVSFYSADFRLIIICQLHVKGDTIHDDHLQMGPRNVHILLQLQLKLPRKPRGKGREKSAVASSVTQDLEHPAAENPEAGKEHDGPLTVRN